MTVITDESQIARPSYSLGSTSGQLSLVVHGEGKQTTVRITQAKCSLGSSPNCTIRLRDEQVQPLHCIILRGPDRTVVHNLAENTRLNGQKFRDAEFNADDCLQIGRFRVQLARDDRQLASSQRQPASTQLGSPQTQPASAQLLESPQLSLTARDSATASLATASLVGRGERSDAGHRRAEWCATRAPSRPDGPY